MESTNRSCSVNLSIVSSFGSSKYWFLSYHQSCSSRPMKGARNLPSLKLTANLPWKPMVGRWMSFSDGLFSRAKCLFQGGYPKWKVSPPWFGRLRAPGFSLWQAAMVWCSCSNSWLLMPRSDGISHSSTDFCWMPKRVQHIRLAHQHQN